MSTNRRSPESEGYVIPRFYPDAGGTWASLSWGERVGALTTAQPLGPDATTIGIYTRYRFFVVSGPGGDDDPLFAHLRL